MGRRASRAKVLQALFQIEVGEIEPEKAVSYIFNSGKESFQEGEFGPSLVFGVLDQLEHIDKLISEKSPDWDLPRMANVEKTVLRMAVYELLYTPETPIRVVINEAIELAKTFGSEESGAFVNGILDEIRRHL